MEKENEKKENAQGAPQEASGKESSEQAGERKHSHAHNHPNSKEVSNRLARAIGHLEKVKQMVDDGEDCSQILIQLAAVKSAINNAGKVLLTDHIDHCIVDAVEEGDMSKIEELNEAIRKFV